MNLSQSHILALLAPRSVDGATEEALHAAALFRQVTSLNDLLEILPTRPWDLILISLAQVPHGAAVARRIAEAQPVPVVVLTPRPTLPLALEMEGSGVAAMLREPLGSEELALALRPHLGEPLALELEEVGTSGGEDPGRGGGEDPAGGPEGGGGQGPLGTLLGSSPAMTLVFRTLARVMDSTATVLITGESGTGKEVVARVLHDGGPRSRGPFVAVNCAAIPEALLEAELFGYERGAFTGAVGRSDGRIARASGGTLFLDEIGDMSLPLQAKILRMLEARSVERLGGGDPVAVDVRVVAATHGILRKSMASGSFREDLFYRLAVVELQLPPLRERASDLEILALHFAREFSRRYQRRVLGFSGEALERLRAHPWPGNVRELRNVVDRATLLARGGVIRSGDLGLEGPPAGSWGAIPAQIPKGYPPTLSMKEVEARHIRAVLDHVDGHLGHAAAVLGIHRNTLSGKIREYGILPREARR